MQFHCIKVRYSIEPKDDKITSISKKSTKKLPTIDEDAELTTPKKRYISPEERQQIIDELRLVPKN